jgi:ubiquinone/menaquinone biosynthesis C-methylase UbiE
MSDSVALKESDGHICPHQMSFMLDNWFRRLIQHPKKIAGEYIREGDVVLDVGCGPGYFTIDLARMVGETGRVLAIDIQETMLLKVEKKARRHGLLNRIRTHHSRADGIGLDQTVDFILAYYMVHEAPSAPKLLKEFRALLKPNGKILVVEPKMHVSQAAFEVMTAEAQSVGLRVLGYPKGKGGRSVLLGR